MRKPRQPGPRPTPTATEDELLAWVAAVYAPTPMLTVADTPAPFAMFGEPEKHIPLIAVEQMKTVMRLPIARRGALMPDAHLGYAMPIGGVVSLENAISPSFVGYDISCMMQLSLLDLTPAGVHGRARPPGRGAASRNLLWRGRRLPCGRRGSMP